MPSINTSASPGTALIANALNRVFGEVPVRPPAPLPAAAGTRGPDGQPSSVVHLSAQSQLMADLSSLADKISSAKAERQAAAEPATANSVQEGVAAQLADSIQALAESAQDLLTPAADADNSGLAEQLNSVAAESPSPGVANTPAGNQAPSVDDTRTSESKAQAQAQARTQAMSLSLQNQLQQASAAYAQIALMQPPPAAPATAEPARPADASRPSAAVSAEPASHAEQRSPTA